MEEKGQMLWENVAGELAPGRFLKGREVTCGLNDE